MPRIVHLGLGAFARAHLCAFTQEVGGWAVTGVGLLPGDAAVRDAHPERGYDLVLTDTSGQRPTTRITVVDDYVFADPSAVLTRLVDPDTMIVSLTITEGGWGMPSSTLGLVVEGLRRRRAAGLPPYTVLSCDNVQDNGGVAQEAIIATAELAENGLGQWVREQVAFPSSMVDRITPAPLDPRVIVAEPFRQWVIEDRFPLGRPAWEQAGALLVADVVPYELMKLRLLNAGHQSLAYIGVLLGHAFVHEAAAEPEVKTLLRNYWAEALPTLQPVPGVDLVAYQDSLLERFGNPQIADTLARLCAFASDRLPAFLLPVVAESALPTPACAFVVATWARYLEVAAAPVDNRILPGGAALLDHDLFDGVREQLRPDFLAALDDLRRDPRAALRAAGRGR